MPWLSFNFIASSDNVNMLFFISTVTWEAIGLHTLKLMLGKMEGREKGRGKGNRPFPSMFGRWLQMETWNEHFYGYEHSYNFEKLFYQKYNKMRIHIPFPQSIISASKLCFLVTTCANSGSSETSQNIAWHKIGSNHNYLILK
jgi:hypothetical protein